MHLNFAINIPEFMLFMWTQYNQSKTGTFQDQEQTSLDA